MLVPVIGLLQVGHQAMADRYTYVPLIGLFIALVWAAAEWFRARRVPGSIVWAVSGLILLACLVGSWMQLRYWRNSLALWSSGAGGDDKQRGGPPQLRFRPGRNGQLQEAIEHYNAALRIQPNLFKCTITWAVCSASWAGCKRRPIT